MYPAGVCQMTALESRSGALECTARYDEDRILQAQPRYSSGIAKSRLRESFILNYLQGQHDNVEISACQSASTSLAL